MLLIALASFLSLFIFSWTLSQILYLTKALCCRLAFIQLVELHQESPTVNKPHIFVFKVPGNSFFITTLKHKSSSAFTELNILIFLCISAYEPCKLGCNDLEFCTNFNNRPTSLFRSCSKQSDSAARKEFQNWLLTKRPLSPQLQIPVKGSGFFIYCMSIYTATELSHQSEIFKSSMLYCFDCVNFSRNPLLHCFNHIGKSMFVYLLLTLYIHILNDKLRHIVKNASRPTSVHK